jgi:hypothetical protein
MLAWMRQELTAAPVGTADLQRTRELVGGMDPAVDQLLAVQGHSVPWQDIVNPWTAGILPACGPQAHGF